MRKFSFCKKQIAYSKTSVQESIYLGKTQRGNKKVEPTEKQVDIRQTKGGKKKTKVEEIMKIYCNIG